jgi:hypothetical protein
VQRHQDELPGPDREGTADAAGATTQESPDQIRNELIGRPVTTADGIAGASARQRDTVPGQIVGREVGVAIGAGHQLRAALGIGVGIVTTHRVVLAIAPDPFLVLVAFVAGHIDHDAGTLELAHRLEQIDRAHDVCRIGLNRLIVAVANHGLRRHVDDDVGIAFGERGLEVLEVANVTVNGADAFADARLLEEARLGWRIERIAGDIGAQGVQPQAEPAALEAGVSGDEHLAILPERTIQHGQLAPH